MVSLVIDTETNQRLPCAWYVWLTKLATVALGAECGRSDWSLLSDCPPQCIQVLTLLVFLSGRGYCTICNNILGLPTVGVLFAGRRYRCVVCSGGCDYDSRHGCRRDLQELAAPVPGHLGLGMAHPLECGRSGGAVCCSRAPDGQPRGVLGDRNGVGRKPRAGTGPCGSSSLFPALCSILRGCAEPPAQSPRRRVLLVFQRFDFE